MKEEQGITLKELILQVENLQKKKRVYQQFIDFLNGSLENQSVQEKEGLKGMLHSFAGRINESDDILIDFLKADVTAAEESINMLTNSRYKEV